MSFDLLSVPQGYKTDLALVIAPYFDPKFAKRLIKQLSPEKLRYVVDSDARPEDVEKLLQACGKTDVKLALGVSKGILHIKGFYFRFLPAGINREPDKQHRFLFGSANATEAAFSGKRNAELLADVELHQDRDEPLLNYLHEILEAIEEGKEASINAISLGSLCNSPSLFLPPFTICHRDEPPGFDSWLQRGLLAAKYPNPQQFLNVIVRLGKTLPQGDVANIFAEQGLIAQGARDELRYGYLGQPSHDYYEDDSQDSSPGQWKAKYCVWTHLGFWLSNECYKALSHQMRAKSSHDRQARVNELFSNRENHNWKKKRKDQFLAALQQTFKRLTEEDAEFSNYFHTVDGKLNEDSYAKKFDAKIKRDIYLADDKDFRDRYVKGYEFLKVPSFRQDAGAWHGFVRSWAETLGVEAGKTRPNSLMVRVAWDLGVNPEELSNDEISDKLRKSWGKTVPTKDGKRMKFGERLINYFRD